MVDLHRACRNACTVLVCELVHRRAQMTGVFTIHLLVERLVNREEKPIQMILVTLHKSLH